MNINWNIFKGRFLDFCNDIYNYEDFEEKMNKLDIINKGIFFEYFCKLYFKLNLIMKHKYKKIYMYNELTPQEKINKYMPSNDKGIDCIAIDNTKKIYAIQVKYRTKKYKKIPFGEIATFIGLSYGTKINIYKCIFFTNCIDVCDELKNDKYILILYNSLVTNCNAIFWKNVKEYITTQEITKYKIKQPLKHQENILSIMKKYYDTNNYGRLYSPCGTGKTFLCYWFNTEILKNNKIFIVVPSLYLLSQTYECWMKEQQYEKIKYHFILIGSNIYNNNELLSEFDTTTKKDIIEKELLEYKKVVVILTYQSSDILIKICKKHNYKFDFGNYDEVHKTVGFCDKLFTKLIKSNIDNKRLCLTATEKIYIGNDDLVLSMDNKDIYGNLIYNYSLKNAIDDDVLVDYRIVAPYINSYLCDEKYKYEYCDIKLNISLIGKMIINTINEYNVKHLLIFSNTNKKAEEISEFLDLYSKAIDKKINVQFISGNDNMRKRKHMIDRFIKSDCGIICSAKIFGEGVDIDICDAICFVDNKQSVVDIIQYIGRCLRKCEKLPNKIAHIIIPTIIDSKNFFESKHSQFKLIRSVLKTLGITDKHVTEKVNIYECDILHEKNNLNIKKISNKITTNNDMIMEKIYTQLFSKTGEIIDIRKNKLIFKNDKRYNKNKKLLITKNKCVKYLKKYGFDEPENIFNWIEYACSSKLFNLLKLKYYTTFDEFKNACVKYNINSIKSYKLNYNKDIKLPPYKFINNGFYYDIIPKLNLSLFDNIDDTDF